MDEPRVTSTPAAALNPRVITPRPAQERPPSGTVSESGSATPAGNTDALKEIDRGTIGNKLMQSLSQLLPTEVLSSPSLTKAEWAWRSFLMDTLLGQALSVANSPAGVSAQGAEMANVQREAPPPSQWTPVTAKEPSGQQPEVAAANPSLQGTQSLAQNAMSQWWNSLGQWARALERGMNQANWSGSLPDASVIPFSRLSKGQTAGLPPSQQREVVADRIVSSIVSENGSHYGFGLFVPPQTDGSRPQYPAIRWKGERQTRIDRRGQRIHRLSLEFQLQQWPVHVVLLSAKPSLQVHIRTNHPVLRTFAASPDGVISEQLSQAGWHLDRWTLASLQEEET